MSGVAQMFPKAFAVWFKDLDRWDYGYFRKVSWRWEEKYIKPVGEVLTRKNEAVEKTDDFADIPIIEKISFGGVITVTEAEERKGYKGRLFWAESGDLIYSKIRAKQGSLAVVPSFIERLAVSAEYPVYSINTKICDAAYLTLVLKSNAFLNLLVGLSHGGSTKTRIPPESFEALEIALPPLPVQRAIVARWRLAKDEASASKGRIEKLRAKTDARFLADLGLNYAPRAVRPRAFAVMWEEMMRWGVNYNQLAQSGEDITRGKYPVCELGSILELVQYGTSEKANSTSEGVPILRIGNIKERALDLSNLKFITLSKKDEQNLSLVDGDILIIRTSGSRDLVGTCAVFRGEGRYVFASYLIRLRVQSEQAHPDFISWFVNSPLGRQQVDSTSRQIMQSNINSEEIRSLEVPLPPLEVQREIVRRVEEGRAEIAREREQAARRAREAEAEVEALILGTQQIEPKP